MNSKPWWASITFWLNAIGILIALLTNFTTVFGAQYPQVAVSIGSVVAFLNIIRRALNPNAPLTITDKRSL